MTDIFISDLHLSEERPELYRAFCRFLGNLDRDVEHLYILGDLFDAFIGDDPKNPMCIKVKAQLRLLADRHIRVFFQPGNRDFLLRGKVAEKYGMTALPDYHLYQHLNNRALLMHGDLLCTDDRSYLFYRSIIQSLPARALIALLPMPWRRALARKLRTRSTSKQRQPASMAIDVNAEAVKAAMDKYEVAQLIHGHTHLPGVHRENSTDPRSRFVLGDWNDRGIWWIEAKQGGFSLKSQPL